VAAFIAAQRDAHRIPHGVACRALGVSQSWFYKWASHAGAGTLPPRAARRARLAAEVRRLFALHQGKRGSPMITADLQDAGWRVSENTVAALMAEQGLAARPKRRRKATTRPGRGRWRAPDLVKRQFPAARLNQKWYGDGTEIPTGEGKLYLTSAVLPGQDLMEVIGNSLAVAYSELAGPTVHDIVLLPDPFSFTGYEPVMLSPGMVKLFLTRLLGVGVLRDRTVVGRLPFGYGCGVRPLAPGRQCT